MLSTVLVGFDAVIAFPIIESEGVVYPL